jgi:adenylyltransferase/sulfurtransferase
MMAGIPEITPQEVKRMMDENQPFVLIDVREPREFQRCRIAGSRLIPLAEVPKRIHELDSSQEVVVHCRSGQRSAKAVEWLIKAGFRKIHNLKGGILAWSDQVDPSVPKY